MTSTSTARGTFGIKSWDEEPWAEDEGDRKVTHARIAADYRGDIEGEGLAHSIMCYPAASTASYAGYERIVGKLAGRSGAFVLEVTGTFENDVATSSWTVVPGSGTGELAGIRGTGGYAARHGESEIAYRLDYSFD